MRIKMKIKKSQILYFLIMFLITFQLVIQEKYSFFSSFDELLALLVLALGTLDFIHKRLDKIDQLILVFFILFSITGWLGSLIYSYQNLTISVESYFLSIKFFIILFGFRHINLKKIDSSIVGPTKLVIILVFIYYIASAFDVVAPFKAFDICAKVVFLLSILIIFDNNVKKNILYILMLFCTIAFLGKAKSYAIVALFVFAEYFICNKNAMIKTKNIIIIFSLLLLVGWSDIEYYYIAGYNHFARSVLFLTSFLVAKDYFPIGGGWGTFGTYYAGVSYSPLYYKYGISSHVELGINSKSFLSDTYWPSILGETGIIGLFVMIIFLYKLFKYYRGLYFENINKYAAAVLAFSYMLLTTFEESGFMQPALICLAFIMSYLLKKYESLED